MGVWKCHNPGTAVCKAREDSLKCPPKGPVKINGTAETFCKGQPGLCVEPGSSKHLFSTGLPAAIVFQQRGFNCSNTSCIPWLFCQRRWANSPPNKTNQTCCLLQIGALHLAKRLSGRTKDLVHEAAAHRGLMTAHECYISHPTALARQGSLYWIYIESTYIETCLHFFGCCQFAKYSSVELSCLLLPAPQQPLLSFSPIVPLYPSSSGTACPYSLGTSTAWDYSREQPGVMVIFWWHLPVSAHLALTSCLFSGYFCFVAFKASFSFWIKILHFGLYFLYIQGGLFPLSFS